MATTIKYFICGAILLVCFTINSCMNKYEHTMIGYYKVYKFEILDSSKKIDLPNLVLNEDKSFILTFTDKKITGKWKANDYGDWIVIDFLFDNQHAQGIVLGQNYDIIENLLDFDIGNIKSFSFKRVENH